MGIRCVRRTCFVHCLICQHFFSESFKDFLHAVVPFPLSLSQRKVTKFFELVSRAAEFHLPLNIMTRSNSGWQFDLKDVTIQHLGDCLVSLALSFNLKFRLTSMRRKLLRLLLMLIKGSTALCVCTAGKNTERQRMLHGLMKVRELPVVCFTGSAKKTKKERRRKDRKGKRERKRCGYWDVAEKWGCVYK